MHVFLVSSSPLILLLYVNDMLIAGLHMNKIKQVKLTFSKEFEMKDLGEAKKVLGMHIL